MCRKSFWWQAQYFCVVFRRWIAFFVAGAALWRPPSSFCVAGAALQTCRVAWFLRIALSGLHEVVTWCKFRGRRGFVRCIIIDNWREHRTKHRFWGSKFWGSWKKLVGKPRFWSYKVWRFEEVSHEMLVLRLQHVSSRFSGFLLPSPCLWGKLPASADGPPACQIGGGGPKCLWYLGANRLLH